MKRFSLMTISLTILALLSLHTAFAQTPPASDGPDGGPGGKPGMMQKIKDRVGGMKKQIEELGLSAEQKAKVDALMKEERELRRETGAKMHEAMKALGKITAENPGDESAVRTAAKAVSAIGEEMAVLRAKGEAKLQALLTPEQKAKRIEQLAKFRDEMKERGKKLREDFDKEFPTKDPK